jgi:hypothetical protein
MPTLIFDIETIGENFDELDETSQEVLTRWIKKDATSEEQYQHSLESVKNGLGFSPLSTRSTFFARCAACIMAICAVRGAGFPTSI